MSKNIIFHFFGSRCLVALYHWPCPKCYCFHNMQVGDVITQVYWQCGRTLYVLECNGLYTKTHGPTDYSRTINNWFFLTSRCTNKRCKICTIHNECFNTIMRIKFNCSSQATSIVWASTHDCHSTTDCSAINIVPQITMLSTQCHRLQCYQHSATGYNAINIVPQSTMLST